MRRHKIFIGAVLIIIIVAALIGHGLKREKILVFIGGQGEKEHVIAVPNRVFTLGYIHSVHHTPVYEVIYICDDNTLALKELRYSSLGVGMPYGYEGGTLENVNGEFVLKFERKFQSISMMVSPIPEHTVTVDRRDYPLIEFTKPGGPLEIKAADRWSFKLLRYGRKGA